MDSLFRFSMKNWFKRAYFEVSTTSEKFHYISRDLHLVNLDHCAIDYVVTLVHTEQSWKISYRLIGKVQHKASANQDYPTLRKKKVKRSWAHLIS